MLKMSIGQTLRASVKQRLIAAAQEIFELFERTLAEYEEELCKTRAQNLRQQKLLEAVFNPEVRLNRADVQQMLVSEGDFPSEQQEQSLSVAASIILSSFEDCSSSNQEDPDPPHIKEEQEELWTSQEQLQRLDEADIISIPARREDEEKPQSSWLLHRQTEQMKIGGDRGDCGGSEAARHLHPDRLLPPVSDEETSDSSEPDTAGRITLSCSECGKQFRSRTCLKRHMMIHAGWKPCRCSVCGKSLTQSGLRYHMKVHTGEKPFSCSLCGKRFPWKSNLKTHMITHLDQRLFSCPECDLRFKRKGNLLNHIRIHSTTNHLAAHLCAKISTVQKTQVMSPQQPEAHI